jgi:hypothetical protein
MRLQDSVENGPKNQAIPGDARVDSPAVKESEELAQVEIGRVDEPSGCTVRGQGQAPPKSG